MLTGGGLASVRTGFGISFSISWLFSMSESLSPLLPFLPLRPFLLSAPSFERDVRLADRLLSSEFWLLSAVLVSLSPCWEMLFSVVETVEAADPATEAASARSCFRLARLASNCVALARSWVSASTDATEDAAAYVLSAAVASSLGWELGAGLDEGWGLGCAGEAFCPFAACA